MGSEFTRNPKYIWDKYESKMNRFGEKENYSPEKLKMAKTKIDFCLPNLMKSYSRGYILGKQPINRVCAAAINITECEVEPSYDRISMYKIAEWFDQGPTSIRSMEKIMVPYLKTMKEKSVIKQIQKELSH